MKPILDAACGSRMLYFDKNDDRVHFNDLSTEEKELCDGRKLVVSPETNWDFTQLPVPDESFYMVVFDPPHLLHAGDDSWLKAKYMTTTIFSLAADHAITISAQWIWKGSESI